MMTWQLEAVDQMYIVLYELNDYNSVTLVVGRGNRREFFFFFLDHNRLVKQVVQRLWTTVNKA